jgi:hypothetical protein
MSRPGIRPSALSSEEIDLIRNTAAVAAGPIADQIWRVMAGHQDGGGVVSGVNALACIIALKQCAVPILASATDHTGWNELIDWFCEETRNSTQKYLEDQ